MSVKAKNWLSFACLARVDEDNRRYRPIKEGGPLAIGHPPSCGDIHPRNEGGQIPQRAYGYAMVTLPSRDRDTRTLSRSSVQGMTRSSLRPRIPAARGLIGASVGPRSGHALVPPRASPPHGI